MAFSGDHKNNPSERLRLEINFLGINIDRLVKESDADPLKKQVNAIRIESFQEWLTQIQGMDFSENTTFLLRIVQMLNFLSRLSPNYKLHKDGMAEITRLMSLLKKSQLSTVTSPTHSELDPNKKLQDIMYQISPIFADFFWTRPLQDLQTTSIEDNQKKKWIEGLNQSKLRQYECGIKVAAHLYTETGPDYSLLRETLDLSHRYLKDPHIVVTEIAFAANYKSCAKKIDGKPVAWQQYLGAFLFVVGVAVIILGAAGIPFSLGTSSLGIKIGWGITSYALMVLGGTLYKCGQQDPESMSAAVSDLDEKGHEVAKCLPTPK